MRNYLRNPTIFLEAFIFHLGNVLESYSKRISRTEKTAKVGDGEKPFNWSIWIQFSVKCSRRAPREWLMMMRAAIVSWTCKCVLNGNDGLFIIFRCFRGTFCWKLSASLCLPKQRVIFILLQHLSFSKAFLGKHLRDILIFAYFKIILTKS